MNNKPNTTKENALVPDVYISDVDAAKKNEMATQIQVNILKVEKDN